MPMMSSDFGAIVEPRQYAEGGDVEGLDIAELLAGFLPGAGLSAYLHNPEDDSIYGLLDKLGAAGDVMMLASPMAGPAFGGPLLAGGGLKALSRLGRLRKAAATPKAVSGAAVTGYSANEMLKDAQDRRARLKSSDYRRGGLVYLAEGGDGGEGGGDHGDAGGGPGGDGGGLGSGDAGGAGASGGDSSGGGGDAGGGPGGDGGGLGSGDSAGGEGGLGLGSAGDAGQGLGLGDSAGLGEAGYGDPSGPEVGDPADPGAISGLAAIAGLDDTGLDPAHVADIQAAMDADALAAPDPATVAPDMENQMTQAQMLRTMTMADLDPAIRFNPAATIADLALSFTPVGVLNSALSALGWADKALGLKTGVDSLGSMAAAALGLEGVTLATNRDMRALRSGDLAGLGLSGSGPSSNAGEPSGSRDRFGDADPYPYGIGGNYLYARGGLAHLKGCG